MPFLSDKDRINLNTILMAVDKIENFTKDISDSKKFYEDEKTFDSVLMNFVVIGESVARLDDDIRNLYSDVSWNKIKSFRNLIAHNYFGVDAEEVWQLISSHLPNLRKRIEEILSQN
jgi:uncharacterized protein with HEPN domain